MRIVLPSFDKCNGHIHIDVGKIQFGIISQIHKRLTSGDVKYHWYRLLKYAVYTL